MIRILRTMAVASVAASLAGGSLAAQTPESSKTAPAYDPSERLRDVLPADVAQRVIDRIAAARARELPAQALENRALKFAARGVKPEEIERAVAAHATRLEQSKQALEAARAKRPSADEIEGGAEAIRAGVDGAKIGEVAKSAPKDRPLGVAFSVLSALASNGLPVDQALSRVKAALDARASDAELENLAKSLPAQAADGQRRKPAVVGRELAETKRPAGVGAGGPPSGVPANGGSGVSPVQPPVQPPVSRP